MAEQPKWGSPEFEKAVNEHDAKAEPKREEKGLKYTTTRNPANPPKPKPAKKKPKEKK